MRCSRNVRIPRSLGTFLPKAPLKPSGVVSSLLLLVIANLPPFPCRTIQPGGQKLCRRLEVLIKSLCLNPAKYIFCGKWAVKSQCGAHCFFHLAQTRPEAASPKEMTIKRRPAVM